MNDRGVDTGTFLQDTPLASSVFLYMERDLETFPEPALSIFQRPTSSTPNLSSLSLEGCCSMGRQSTDPSSPTVASSSIALLQERFRELQRVKQRREERELRRLSLEPDLVVAPVANPDHLAMFCFQPSMSSSSPPQDYCSLSLGLTTQGNRDKAGSGAVKTDPRMSLWPRNNSLSISGTSKGFECPDVDTSLHL